MEAMSGIAKSPTKDIGGSFRTNCPDHSSECIDKNVVRHWVGKKDYQSQKKVERFVLTVLKNGPLPLDDLHTLIRQTGRIDLLEFLPYALRALSRQGNRQHDPEIASIVRSGQRVYFLNPGVTV
jgi:hypothetical protein